MKMKECRLMVIVNWKMSQIESMPRKTWIELIPIVKIIAPLRSDKMHVFLCFTSLNIKRPWNISCTEFSKVKNAQSV